MSIDKEIAEKRVEQQRSFPLIDSNKNSIPNLEYVYEGKKYHGASVANMIKDVGWKPKPAGKNSRKAQENRLKQFMDWYTKKIDNNNSITEILTIYSSMIEKERNKIYEPMIEILLLNALYHAEDETIFTTRNKFFQSLNIFSYNFKHITIQYYVDTIPEEYVNDISDIDIVRNAFYDSVNSKLRELIFPTLDSLQRKKKIRYSINTVIITSSNERIDVSELTIKEKIQINKKILDAERYAIEHTYYYNYNAKKIFCKDWADIVKFKKEKRYKKIYENYIAENFGWNYTYEEIQITAGTKQSIKESICNIEQDLRNLLIKYLKKNAITKYQNRDKKWNTIYQNFVNEISEKTRLTIDCYQDDVEKMKMRIRPYPKYFTDIFAIMIDTEINCDKEIEKKVEQWKRKPKINN